MGKREENLKQYIDNASNGSKEVITYAMVGHLLDTKTENKTQAIQYVAAVLNGDIIGAGGVSNNPEAKTEFMKRTGDLSDGIGMVIAGDELISQGVEEEDVAKTAIISSDAIAFQREGTFNVKGKDIQMDENAKNMELARRFVEILAKGKNAIVNCYKRAVAGAQALVKFLGLKKKEKSDRWNKVIDSSARKCEHDEQKLISKLHLTPVRSVSYGPSI